MTSSRSPLPLDVVTLKVFRHYLTREYPNEVRACLAELSEDEIWAKPNAGANSVGHLVLHLAGATRHLVEDGVGGVAYQRDRDVEFGTTDRPSKADLLGCVDDVVERVTKVLDATTPASLAELSDRTEFKVSKYQLLIGALAHLAYHTGQIVWATKAAKPGVFATGDLYKKAREG
jgi:uncharacterized damage-inducible protein DinB